MGICYNIIHLNTLFFFFFVIKRGQFGGAAEAFGGALPCPCLEPGPISSTSYGCVDAQMDLWAESVNLGTHTNINYHHHLAAGLARKNRFSTAGLFLLAVWGQVRELTNQETGYLGP